MPESIPHQHVADRLRLILAWWAERSARQAQVARNLAIRWLENAPSIGIDPDVCVLEPPPPGFDDLSRLCLWKPGHAPPSLCIEVVSAGHPYKDYVAIQDRYAVFGARELVVFDPLLSGPPSLGGPVALQIWRRDAAGLFERVHFGDDPGYSVVLEAWLHPRGRTLDIADDPRGQSVWLTAEEHERSEKERANVATAHERAEKERERAEKETERAARIELERRVAELEAHREREG